MRILIYDNNLEDLENLCMMVQDLPFDTFIDKLSDVDDFIHVYNRHEYNIVFIDVNYNEGKELVRFIEKKNPSQRIAVINNGGKVFSHQKCSFCKENFNKYRVSKPVNMQEVINVFKGKKCEYNSDDRLLTKLMILSKPYLFMELDKKSLKFTSKNSTSFISSVVNLTEELSANDINYEVHEDYIQILEC